MSSQRVDTGKGKRKEKKSSFIQLTNPAGGHELTQQTLQGLRMQISCLRISLEKEKEKCKSLTKQIAQNAVKLDASSVDDNGILYMSFIL